MALFPKNPNESAYPGGKKHFVDVLKNLSPNDTMIFKNPQEDFNTGSTLIVQPGEAAIFVNGGNIEYVFGDGSYTLTTQNYPFITRLRTSISGGVSSFHCLVYFVRTATSREMSWGTETPIKVQDWTMVDPTTGRGTMTEIRARGSYRYQPDNPALFLKELIGGNYELTRQESIDQFFRTQFQSKIRSSLTGKLKEYREALEYISSEIDEFSIELQPTLSAIMSDYGLRLVNFNISAMDVVENALRLEFQEQQNERSSTIYGAKAERLRYEALGTDFQQAQSFEILQNAASNPGSPAGGLMGAGMGLGMGLGAAQPTGDLMSGMVANLGRRPEQTSDSTTETPAATPSMQPQPENTAGTSSPLEKMNSLKQMLDAGFVSPEEFETKRQQILGEM